MTKTLKNKLEQLPNKRRKKVDKRAEELIAEEMTLHRPPIRVAESHDNDVSKVKQ